MTDKARKRKTQLHTYRIKERKIDISTTISSCTETIRRLSQQKSLHEEDPISAHVIHASILVLDRKAITLEAGIQPRFSVAILSKYQEDEYRFSLPVNTDRTNEVDFQHMESLVPKRSRNSVTRPQRP